MLLGLMLVLVLRMLAAEGVKGSVFGNSPSPDRTLGVC